MMLVKSRYLKIVSCNGNNVLYHSLYGNPVKVDDNVMELIGNFSISRSPEFLEKYIKLDNNAFYALQELISLGFIVLERRCDERNKWLNLVQNRYKKAGLFSSGLVLVITTECNFSCDYCIAKTAFSNIESMSFSTDKRAIDTYIEYIKLYKFDLNEKIAITFTGGEPLLEFNLIRHVCTYTTKKYNYLNFKFRLITNASLIDDNIAKYFSDNDFEIVVSLDDDTSGNVSRKYSDGTLAYDFIFSCLDILVKNNCSNISISSVYNKFNYKLNGNFYKKLSSFGISNATLNIDNLSLLPTSPIKLAKYFLALRSIAKENGIDLTGQWATPATNLRSKSTIWALCSGAAHSRLYVLPDGSIPFCEYHPKYMGHLDNFDKLCDEILASVNRHLVGCWAECEGCEIEGFCSPCPLEKEIIHNNNYQHQQEKCEFIKICTRILLLED